MGRVGCRIAVRIGHRIYNCGLTTNRQFDKMGHTQKREEELMRRRVGVGQRRSLNVQAYVDAQKVASLASFMLGRGLLGAPQYGQIIQEAFDFYLSVMRESHQGEFEEFSTIGEALEWLARNGFSMAQFKDGGGYNGTIQRARAEEAYEMDFGRSIPQAKTLAGRPGYAGQFSLERSPVLQVSQEQLERDVAKALKEYGEKTLREPETLEEAVERRAREDRERREQMAMASELLREPTYTPEQILENKKKGLATLLAKNFVGKQTDGQIFPVPKELEELCGDEEVLKMAEEMATRLLEERGKE